MEQKRLIPIAAGVFGAIVILSLVFAFMRLNSLYVVSTDPPKNTIATVSPFITLTFNQEIESIETATLNDETTPIKLQGKKVVVNTPGLKEETSYRLVLQNIRSTSGRQLEEYVLKFTPQYVDYDSLSPTTKQALVDKSNSGQVDDPFLRNEFPRLSESLDYSISLEEVDASTGKISVRIDFMDEYSSDPRKPNQQLSNDKAEEMRTKALNEIKTLGGNPDKYHIRYSNNYLNQKYPPTN